MKKLGCLFILALLTLSSCNNEPEVKKSNEKKILSFRIFNHSNASIIIDHQQATISIGLPDGTSITSLTPIISVSDKAYVDPPSGRECNFTTPMQFTVTAEDGSALTYTATASVLSAQKQITTIKTLYHDGVISGNNISIQLPYGIDLKALRMTATVSAKAVCTPNIFSPQNYTSPLSVTVTAEDGSTNTYTITVTHKPQDTAVRAVWVPSSAHTQSFMNYANAQASINLLDELNFNTIYLCAWASQQTCFDSQILHQHSTWGSARNGNFFAGYNGGTDDALRDIITLAHAKGMKVILWFEYGFMAEWRARGTGGVTTSNKIFAKHPEWIGINSAGEQANYNGTDYYFNGYDPEVQEFMIKLMEEALTLYPDLDGIQGDDRMPAAPRDSGYEISTKALYKKEKGTDPPSNFQDPSWVRWRLDRLNAFGRLMHLRIRAQKSNAIVCFSPNKYPWCEQNLMQDWPQWIKDGIVQILSVQCYVKPSYSNDVATNINTIKSTGNTLSLLNPGMILKNGNVLLTEEELVSQLKINRQFGTNGEAQFWFDGLKEPYIQKVFKVFYAGKALFPSNL